jgi:hypothetical protein
MPLAQHECSFSREKGILRHESRNYRRRATSYSNDAKFGYFGILVLSHHVGEVRPSSRDGVPRHAGLASNKALGTYHRN